MTVYILVELKTNIKYNFRVLYIIYFISSKIFKSL